MAKVLRLMDLTTVIFRISPFQVRHMSGILNINCIFDP